MGLLDYILGQDGGMLLLVLIALTVGCFIYWMFPFEHPREMSQEENQILHPEED